VRKVHKQFSAGCLTLAFCSFNADGYWISSVPYPDEVVSRTWAQVTCAECLRLKKPRPTGAKRERE
jgi:hypothetical protein